MRSIVYSAQKLLKACLFCIASVEKSGIVKLGALYSFFAILIKKKKKKKKKSKPFINLLGFRACRWAIFESIERHSKVKTGGYTSLQDVTSKFHRVPLCIRP